MQERLCDAFSIWRLFGTFTMNEFIVKGNWSQTSRQCRSNFVVPLGRSSICLSCFCLDEKTKPFECLWNVWFFIEWNKSTTERHRKRLLFKCGLQWSALLIGNSVAWRRKKRQSESMATLTFPTKIFERAKQTWNLHLTLKVSFINTFKKRFCANWPSSQDGSGRRLHFCRPVVDFCRRSIRLALQAMLARTQNPRR